VSAWIVLAISLLSEVNPCPDKLVSHDIQFGVSNPIGQFVPEPI